MNRFRSLVAAAVAVSALTAFGGTALAAPATTDPAASAAFGARYLASIQNPDGSLPGFSVATSTEDGALAFAAAGGPSGAFDNAVAYLQGHVAAATSSGGVDTAGGLAKLILVAHAAGLDPNAFGGTAAENHLVDRLLATKRDASDPAHDGGLFGSQSPTYDGAFRQALALLALEAAGAAIPADATAWLTDQQCPDNGWMSYRAHTDPQTLEACHGFDANTFTGEDSNSTALAAEALAALGATPPQGDPLDFLDAMQNADGGFGQFAGNPTDANSTGVVLQAIVAEGEDPAAGRWSAASATPETALLALQIGCSGAVADRGAFAFQPGEGGALSADAFATAQAVPGIAEVPLPIDPSDLAASLPALDCTTTQGSASGSGGGSVATTTTTAAVSNTAVQAAGATTGATIPATGATGPGHSVVPLAVIGALLVLVGLTLTGAARRTARQQR
jgi:hypothetical protein